MNKRVLKKHRLTLLIKLDTDRSGALPVWWWTQGQEALAYPTRWPLHSARYRRLMRKAGHAVQGGHCQEPRWAKGFAMMGPGIPATTWPQWRRRLRLAVRS